MMSYGKKKERKKKKKRSIYIQSNNSRSSIIRYSDLLFYSINQGRTVSVTSGVRSGFIKTQTGCTTRWQRLVSTIFMVMPVFSTMATGVHKLVTEFGCVAIDLTYLKHLTAPKKSLTRHLLQPRKHSPASSSTLRTSG